MQKNRYQQRKKRSLRVRGRLTGKRKKLRVAVFRSSKHIYAQIIDDTAHKTLASYSSLQMSSPSGDKTKIAQEVGIELGKQAVEKSIQEVFFDRSCYLYHGRVKALAEGLRQGGLQF